MHHVALDRPRPDDRHLDDEVVELPGFQPRQHGHLRPTLDLEDAERVGAADHVVDLRILGRHLSERQPAAVAGIEQFEGAAQARQHAQRQDVDLEDADRVEVVLVPFDHPALVHRRLHDRHHLVEPVAGDDEAADVLGEMPGKAHDVVGVREEVAHHRIAHVETGGRRLGFAEPGRGPAPGRPGKRVDRVVRKPDRLGHLAQRRARPVGHHRRGERGAAGTVLLVDVGDDLVATFVLEVDVDVRRLVALDGDEALEQMVDDVGPDIGDAEAEADNRIRRRSPPLAEDSPRAGKRDDVVDGEEVAGVVEFGDDGEFVADQPLDLLRHAAGIAQRRALPGEAFELRLRLQARLGRLVRVVVLELRQREAEALGEADRLGDRPRVAAEQPRHLGRSLEMAFGIGAERIARLRDPDVQADRGQHVLQLSAGWRVVEHVVDRHQRHAGRIGEGRRGGDAEAVVAAIARPDRDTDAAGEAVGEAAQQGERLVGGGGEIRQDGERQAFPPVEEVGAPEVRSALFAAQIGFGEHAAEMPPALAVLRIGEHVGCAVRKRQPRSRMIGEARLLRLQPGPDRAGDRVAVGEPERRQAELPGRDRQFLWRRGAAQEGEVRVHRELGIGGRVHAKTPCMNQRGVGSAAP